MTNMSAGRRLGAAALVLSVGVVLSRLLGYVREGGDRLSRWRVGDDRRVLCGVHAA